MNFIKAIKAIQDDEMKVEWDEIKNFAPFNFTLEVAKLIREGDESGELNKKEIKEYIILLASYFGLKVIEKRETNGTWEG